MQTRTLTLTTDEMRTIGNALDSRLDELYHPRNQHLWQEVANVELLLDRVRKELEKMA